MPIVVLPGLGVSRYLRSGCAHLAQQAARHVLLIDPPGFGASAGALQDEATVPAVAKRLAECLRGWGPVLLVGQSTGCLLAARLARAGPGERQNGLDVRALALVGPVFDPARSTLAQAGLRLLMDGVAEPWWLGPSEVPEWVRNSRSLPSYLRSCLDESLEEHLDTAGCEIVVVRGDRDPLSRHEWAAHLVDQPARTLVTVPGGAHTHMAGRPQSLAESLDAGRFGHTVPEST